MRKQASTEAQYSKSLIFHSFAEKEEEVIAVVNNLGVCKSSTAEMLPQHSSISDLTRRLQKVDFAIVETSLYLDAYPNSKEALAYYHKLITERDMLAERLAALGNPITQRDNVSGDQWLWTKGPWPWQNEAN